MILIFGDFLNEKQISPISRTHLGDITIFYTFSPILSKINAAYRSEGRVTKKALQLRTKNTHGAVRQQADPTAASLRRAYFFVEIIL